MTGSEARPSFVVLGLPRPLKRTWFALFLLAVGTVVGGVPGFQLLLASWMVFSWFLLGCIVLASAACAIAHAAMDKWRPMRVEAGQIAYMLLAAATFPALFALPKWVDLVESHARLEAQAAAAERMGGVRLALTEVHNQWVHDGTVYDPSGEIMKPPDQRSRRWRDSEPASFWLDRPCIEGEHLVGSYYHWRDTCGRLF